MTRKPLRILLQILLLGLLLGATSTAYADAIAISSVSFTNLQITPAAGTILFGANQASATVQALNSLVENDIDFSNTLPIAQASAAVTFASASATAITNPFSASANSFVGTSCICSAVSFGIASLSSTFVIVGGTGNVDVTISGLFTTMQNALRDQFGLLAQSDVSYSLTVDDILAFSNAFTVVAVGLTSSDQKSRMDQMEAVISLEFDVPHTIAILLKAQSTGIDNEVPEPATIVLLISGVGVMSAARRRRRG